MESREISDAQISASSVKSLILAAIRGRLNLRDGEDNAGGAWVANYRDRNQWLQVDLGSSRNITQLATQGRNGKSHWVSNYKVKYSGDGTSFHCYQEHGTDKVCELTNTCAFFASVMTSRVLRPS